MATLKKFDLQGNEVGSVEIADSALALDVNTQLVKDYLISIRANLRQWSANTKERNEVNHTTAKPHPQKGTGRARQGSLAAPQYKGGGVVFGPKPKFDQHVKVNKKEKRAAIRYLLSQKIQKGQLIILSSADMDQPKTKTIVQFLEKTNLANKRVMYLVEKPELAPEGNYHTFTKSMRNIKKQHFKHIDNVNGYELAINQGVVLMESALEELKAILGAV
jgi:large subunit ribosomal protein L4